MLEVAVEAGGDPMIGKILMGRYRIVALLGEGGRGKVYLAEQKMGTATRKVAIKTLHPELGNDPQLVARFHRESETVIELSHPNTIQFYDFGDLDDGTLFIVMEYIEGESLAHVLQRGAIDPARVDKLLIQICGSLQEAHQIGIVHRDLKPENVLLTDRGGQTDFVKVLDFGIAKRSEAEDDSKAKLTKQGMVLGTPPYMSPEQFSGQALDARSDIYSLAVMTYEMLTGKLPFEAKTPWEWATKHLTAAPQPLDVHPVGALLTDRKKHAIGRALAKNRDERHATALEFLQDFTGFQDAQAAWTMATSAGGLMPPTPSPHPAGATPAGQPRMAVGTPGPMPTSGANAPGSPGQATPNPATGQVVQSPQSYDPSLYVEPKRGGGGKVVALLVIPLFVLGGVAAGGLYWWSQNGGGGQVAVGSNLPGGPGPSVGDPVGIPMVPSTPTEGPPVAPAVVKDAGAAAPPTADPPGEPDPPATQAAPPERPTRPASGRPSQAEEARARQLVASGAAALDRNEVDAAIDALAGAQRIVGRQHGTLGALRTQLGRKGSMKVGVLMQQGRCDVAQALYRRLRSVGAERPSRDHFAGDWCRRP